MANGDSIEENKQREERLKNADGDRWRPSDRARDIARVIVGTFSPSKATEIAKQVLVLLRERDRRLHSRCDGDHKKCAFWGRAAPSRTGRACRPFRFHPKER